MARLKQAARERNASMNPYLRYICLVPSLLASSLAYADCGTWTQRTPTSKPAGGSLRSMAFDSARGVSVLFGGPNGAPNNETWEWNGADWTQRSPANSPLRRLATALAYDSARHVTVMFGGSAFDPNTGAYDSNETWEWDGTNWTQRTPATSPPGRFFHAMAYDSARGVTVLFGGFQSGSNVLDDTWEWNGSDWTQRSPTDSPDPRNGHAMAYDSARGVTVLFGGQANNQTNDETWEWDGTNWTQQTPAQHPGVRRDHGLAFDSSAGVTICFGGVAPGFVLPNDTWEWNGNDWIVANPSTAPTGRDGIGMCFDSSRRVTVIFGGLGNFDETWEFSAGNSIDAQPQPSTHCVGETAKLTISATGSSLTYQWQASTDGGATFNDVTSGIGGTTNSYTTDALALADDGHQYRCIVNSDCGSAQTSISATLTVQDCTPTQPNPDPGDMPISKPCGLCGGGVSAMAPMALFLMCALRTSRRQGKGWKRVRSTC